ncbi:MAG: hypothetical protein ACLQVY_16575 [Limisphaerales bacterium]
MMRETAGGVRSDRSDIKRRLLSFGPSFTESYQRTESGFAELTGDLGKLHANGTKMAEVISQHLADLGGALGENQADGAKGMAASSARELHAGMELTAQELDSLRNVVAELGRLQGQIQVIERIGVFVRSSVLYFAVESARSAECHSTFESFVEELRVLAGKIAEVADSISRHLRETRSLQDRELREMSTDLGTLRDLGQSLELTAAAAAADAQTLFDSSLSALRQASERTRCIARLADEAVYQLQFGDIIRQKSEHIAAALQQTAEQLEAAASDHDFGIQAALTEQVLAIQTGHLELIHREIEGARGKLGDSFQRLADETTQLTAVWDQLQNQAVGSRGSAGSLEGFKLEVKRLAGLHTQCGEVLRNARTNASRAAEASATLAKHVEELKAINREIHLQALNAIVKATRLGEQGGTLSVLSMRVDWLYQDAERASAEVVATLAKILGATGQNDGDSSKADKNADSGADLKRRMKRIESACDGCNEVSSSAAALAEGQRAILASSNNPLDFLSELSAAAAEQIRELASIRSELQGWAIQSPAPATDWLAGMHNRYTMQSERDVHHRANDLHHAKVSPGSDGLESGGFEDFDIPVVNEAKANGTVSSQVSEAAGAVEATPQTTATEPALGDNVDLF